MARRQLLSNEAWAARLAPAVDDREVIRHYTLSEDDFDAIMRKRLDASRLGYALALCLMRHPGRSLEQGEALPVQMVGYVARQLGIAPGVFDNSSSRAAAVTSPSRLQGLQAFCLSSSALVA
jgi:TnpA family transposase